MDANKKKHCIIFFILGIVFIVVSFTSYNYGKNVVIKDLVKSGDIYINKKEYAKAIAVYKEVVKYNNADSDKYMLNLAESMNNSKKSYINGMKYYNKKEYLKAIECFRQVMENDPIAFNKAQEKIKECKEKYIQDNLNKAREAMYNFKYEEANECLNNIFKVDKNIEEAKKMRNALNKKNSN
ncbi:tetratricopeptide repeat protein [Clostridium tepidum]|jgi:tetratricopeptide (TPR) repeat protein|uniref:Tetratricopeptide repeat protein n=1 Tax=Clostridium tepidum TaxID=1962263 RepID=A0ABX3L1N9_9CLOT|nr:hypothetical protein [Clostridium tepidum]MCR1933473.1 hypothetical protein [Clostridium tepidum]MDU6878130.1 hypothetical protein [Clostridium botulinum]OOO61740.1 hypothetical protein BS637_10730 [Clostridium tepidum]